MDDTVYYPQDEMTTILLPVTTGCSYNQCAFCTMYKESEFALVPMTEIEYQLKNGNEYAERIFLTGADPLCIGYDRMVRILNMIKKYCPYCACVASYAAIKSIANYSPDQLKQLHDMGLRLLYIGFESGDDEVLAMLKKGHTVEQAVAQAHKLNEAGLMFNTIIMYGIAGKGGSVSHAQKTASMINRFRTAKVITMNLMLFDSSELYKMEQRGEFTQPDGAERRLEIKTLIENLSPAYPTVFDTTHPTNMIKIKGTLPTDKDKLLGKI